MEEPERWSGDKQSQSETITEGATRNLADAPVQNLGEGPKLLLLIFLGDPTFKLKNKNENTDPGRE